MAEFTNQPLRFFCKGLCFTVPADTLPEGKFPLLMNVRSYIEGTLHVRGGHGHRSDRRRIRGPQHCPVERSHPLQCGRDGLAGGGRGAVPLCRAAAGWGLAADRYRLFRRPHDDAVHSTGGDGAAVALHRGSIAPAEAERGRDGVQYRDCPAVDLAAVEADQTANHDHRQF